MLVDLARCTLASLTSTEQEEREVERLVHTPPKSKPPRRDLRRNRVQEKDTDLQEKDMDLSLNVREVGGSMAENVLVSPGALNVVLSRLDALSSRLPPDQAMELDSISDFLEGATFGPESLASRKAKVIQAFEVNLDETYMDSLVHPTHSDVRALLRTY